MRRILQIVYLIEFSIALILVVYLMTERIQVMHTEITQGSSQPARTEPLSVQAAYKKINSDLELKKVAITFDDGPHPSYTEELLDGLSERKVHATFFVTGENAQKYPKLVKRMKEEGHLVGNHTYSHLQLTGQNRDQYREELQKTAAVIKELTGTDNLYVRPPYGAWDKRFEKELSMFPVLWTVDPLDWCTMDAGKVADRIISRVKDGDIILLHDCYASSVKAALKVVDELQQKDYQFVTVEEMLFE